METRMSEQDLKQENEILKKQLSDLKKKLEDRNPAFNGNLLEQADREYSRLQQAIGQAIYNTVGQDATGIFKNKSMIFDYDSSGFLSSSRGWVVYFNDKETKEIKDKLADLQMKKFQESLDNFAWAVNNRSNI